jgi:hypothetical protein
MNTTLQLERSKARFNNWSTRLTGGKYVLVPFDNAAINVIASLKYLHSSIATAQHRNSA